MCALACFWPAGTAAADPSAAPDAGAYTANGPVFAIARVAGRTYIGGDFTRVGVRSGPGAIVAAGDGARQAFPEVAGGDVRATVSDGSGGWYIGGTFTSVGGASHIGLAHITAAGSVDPGFSPAASDLHGNPAAVDALAYSRSDGTLYVGGGFTKIGVGAGQVHQHLAALSGVDGKPVTAFGPATGCFTGTTCSADVQALAVADVPLTVMGATVSVPVVFAGGGFTAAGLGTLKQAPGIAAFWGAGARDHNGSPIDGEQVADSSNNAWGSTLPGMTLDALALAPASGTTFAVYLGGRMAGDALLQAYQFKISDPTSRATDTPVQFSNWTPVPNGCDGAGCTPTVDAMTVSGDGKTLYFGGDFNSVQGSSGGVPANRVASIATVADPTQPNPLFGTPPTLATPLGGGAPAPVRSLALSSDGSELYLAGDASGPSGPVPGLLALNTSDGSQATWAPAPDDGGEAVATDASSPFVYVGGRFSSLGSVERDGLAAFDSNGALLAWAPAVASTSANPPLVRALAASDTTVYVGGRFDRVAGEDHANLAAVSSGDGSPISGFKPDPSASSGATAEVTSLALLDTTLYVGGQFATISGQPRRDLAALDAASGAASGWDPAPDDIVHAILPACGSIYVAGGFTHIGAGAAARDYIAALDPSTAAATAWDPSAGGAVLSLARFGPTIYAGGNFATIGGQLRQKLAGLSIADGTATAFDPDADATVRALAASDTTLYAAGDFNQIGGAARAKLAALDPNSGVATGWNPGPDATVEVLALGDGALYAGGDFTTVGTTPQRAFAPFGSGAGTPFPAASCGAVQKSAPAPPPSTPPPACSGPKPPHIGRLAIKPKKLRLGKGRLEVRFKVSRCAKVRLRFDRLAHARCRAKHGRHRGKRRCTRYVRFATVSGSVERGANRLKFPHGRVGRRRLAPGSYRVTLTSLPAVHGAPVRHASFTVLPAKHRHGRRRG